MKELIRFSDSEIIISRKDVFEKQGMPADKEPPFNIVAIFERALNIFYKVAEPQGLYVDIEKESFDDIFKGEGKNKSPDPLSVIFPKADFLGLYITTLGPHISHKIDSLIKSDNSALGYMLDAVASEGVESAGTALQKYYFKSHYEKGIKKNSKKILRYSPGYCGWDIRGQKKIFEYIKPDQIDIELSESYFLIPIKSMSGVIIAGDRKIHDFKNDFEFCKACQYPFCRERIKL